jgi:hypothetical protein
VELRDEKDGWLLALQDGLVQLIQIDFRLGLLLSDASGTAQLYIETPFCLNGPNTDVSLTPAKTSSLAPVLTLFNAAVIGVSIRKTGQLKVQFGDGRWLEVGPNDAYEAWQLGGSTGFMLVCSPGGNVSIFNQTEGPDRDT